MRLQPAILTDSLLAPSGLPGFADAVHRADTVADLTRIFVPETQVCVHSPHGSPNRLGALESLHASGWSGLRAVVRLDADGVPDIDALPLPPPCAHPALRRELTFLLELYADLLGCEAIGLRIERLERAMCPRWHVDRTGIRLLCTWCGPGTEWLDDPRIDPLGLPGSAAGAPATGQARPFDILLLKGSAWQGNAAGGAIHRSPQVAPNSGPRILVALDALWD
ncbi:DUF1826 domain-containing protein [Thiocapsa rosea]|uniref:Uncharacterized protein DUF1826 n=1 Tax=Thiocapsa rosea TaxID=69360 RepID=A0A495V7S8_9GAMM|nr:DUF1826 domain-containing protein [Thiocapsa rosea]RKT45456.1 uncharacterized protein DUF1826 [Thiocapsa rosea]